MNRSRIKFFRPFILMLLFLSAVSFTAQAQPSAVRQFSCTDVEPGDIFTVSIDVSDYGIAGKVTETIPEGFSYTASTLDESVAVEVNGRTISFILLGDSHFEYSIQASDMEDSYIFSGELMADTKETYPVNGDSKITVYQSSTSHSDSQKKGSSSSGKHKISSGSGFSTSGNSLIPEPTVPQDPDPEEEALQEREILSGELTDRNKAQPLHGKKPAADGTLTKENSSLSKGTAEGVEGSGTPVEETGEKTPGFGFLLSVGVIGLLYLCRRKA